MAGVSKNARTSTGTHKFECSCGGEIRMRSVFSKGRMKHFAFCEKCKREERRPSSFN